VSVIYSEDTELHKSASTSIYHSQLSRVLFPSTGSQALLRLPAYEQLCGSSSAGGSLTNTGCALPGLTNAGSVLPTATFVWLLPDLGSGKAVCRRNLTGKIRKIGGRGKKKCNV